MPLHSRKTHIEARQSTSKSTEWPRYEPQEHSSMKIKKRMHVNEIKKETCLIIGGELRELPLNDLTFFTNRMLN